MTLRQGWNSVLHAGIATFMGAPLLEKVEEAELRKRNIKAGVIGIPFDSTTITRTGSTMGPRAIRDASCNFLSYHADYEIDIFEKLNLHDCGDSAVLPGNGKVTVENGARVVSEILKAGAIPIIMGGEHLVTVAGTMAVDRTLKGKYGFIMFDCHFDTAMDVGGEKWSHCCPVARTVEFDAFPAENVVIIGPRGAMNPKEELEFIKKNNIAYFTMHQILDIGIEKVVNQALEIATRGTQGFYLSIDMDSLEGAYTPGTCAPTPFGITARELISVLPKFGLNDKLIAFDVVEIAPQYDPSGVTAMTATYFIVELLATKATLQHPCS